MLNRWTRTVVRHRVLVLVVWLALALLGLTANGALNSRLSTSLGVPGTESAQANQILAAHFHENVEGSFTIVVPQNGQRATTIERRVATAVRVVPTGLILQAKSISGVLYLEADTNMDLVHAATWTQRLRAALVAQGLSHAMVTGPAALQNDVTPVLRGDLRRGELVAVLLAFAVLIAVLGLCVAVAIPFVVAAATIATSLLVVYLLSHLMSMVLYVPNVLELIGLGLAIDYSLLIVHRFRAEMRRAPSTTDAIVATMDHAGRTVMISGVAVSVGLATLLLVPVPFLRSLGAAGVAVPLVSIAAALSLQPVLLSLLGARGLRSVGFGGLMGERDRLASSWSTHDPTGSEISSTDVARRPRAGRPVVDRPVVAAVDPGLTACGPLVAALRASRPLHGAPRGHRRHHPRTSGGDGAAGRELAQCRSPAPPGPPGYGHSG